jgi:hypothetical protein
MAEDGLSDLQRVTSSKISLILDLKPEKDTSNGYDLP